MTDDNRVTKEYLGDGLYAHHDGYQFWLTTPQGNAVALEPKVLESFFVYVAAKMNWIIDISMRPQASLTQAEKDGNTLDGSQI